MKAKSKAPTITSELIGEGLALVDEVMKEKEYLITFRDACDVAAKRLLRGRKGHEVLGDRIWRRWIDRAGKV